MAFVLPEDYGYVDQEEVEAEKAAATYALLRLIRCPPT